ncbi:MAG: hypothetical protein IPP61_02035 [Cytophagaceae bacterium]|nr:hypothetical protein [Cytophagaceae bacterium]MBK9934696.1 hypothetical protein [Cytophagaceae bacterium]MBL0301133.1 hypothetical protein [Cytophagaceae bacterium]MBL0323951.1 hypothetical protein [Cytophagaceae bacterium]
MRLVIISIFIIKSFMALGQTLPQTYDFAENMYVQKSFQSAVEAYKRVLFFDSTSQYTKAIYPKIANSLFETGKYTEASEYYDLAYFSEENDSLKTLFLLKKASSNLILKQYDYTQIELMNLSDSLPEIYNEQRDFLESMLYFSKGEFKESEAEFKKLIPDTSLVTSIFKKNQKINKISPKKAKIMSMVIPGLGQLYAGDIKNGLNSLILTGGLFAIGIHSAISNGFFDAAISVLPWFQRYYQGGFNKAEIITKAKIERKRHKIFNQLLDEVNKTGFKPI